MAEYTGKEVSVTWDKRLCIHVAECGRADGELFQKGRKPWCDPDVEGRDDVIDVVLRCPTGAISFESDSIAEAPDEENVITVSNDGPLYFRGDLDIDGVETDMPGVKFRAALCRCGASKNKPFCDNSHRDIPFHDMGSVGSKGAGTEDSGGKLTVGIAPKGPLLLNGNFTMYTGAGRKAWSGTKAALCRCGASKNKPFCDGAHKAIGFGE